LVDNTYLCSDETLFTNKFIVNVTEKKCKTTDYLTFLKFCELIWFTISKIVVVAKATQCTTISEPVKCILS